MANKQITIVEKPERKNTGINARNGDPIYSGDIVQTVQDTIFKVVERYRRFWLMRPEGLYDFEAWMSPNLWIIGNEIDNPNLYP